MAFSGWGDEALEFYEGLEADNTKTYWTRQRAIYDDNPPAPDNPVAPAHRSAHAQAKASCQHDPAGRPYRSFRGLLEHLATLTRNQIQFADATATVPMLAEPTSAQRQAFDLIGVPIPLTLK